MIATETAFSNFAASTVAYDAEALRRDRFLPPSELSEDMKCIGCGAPGWCTLSSRDLQRPGESPDAKICSGCAIKRCIENAFDGIADIDQALSANRLTVIPQISEDSLKWLQAIPGIIP